jgi:hypothetical protein
MAADKQGYNAANFPNSYKDSSYDDMDAKTASQIGIPASLLTSIRLNGEKSNADQVSSAGARTPYQITPGTRQLLIKKYGIDPYMNPQAASYGAGLLLRDSLARNNNDEAQAAGEYIGGPDRKKWGPQTRDYIQRVTGGNDDSSAPASARFNGQVPQVSLPTANDPSQYTDDPQLQGMLQQAGAGLANPQAVQTPMPQITGSSQKDVGLAQLYTDFIDGKMTASGAKQYEADVRAGKVALPSGMTPDQAFQTKPAQAIGQEDAPSKPSAPVLPQKVVDDYNSGAMPDSGRAKLIQDIQAGHVALPQGAKLHASEPSIGDKLIGAGEAGLNAITGAVGGGLGTAAGTVVGIGKSIANGTYGTQKGVQEAEKTAAEYANALTYQPRTQTGQEYAGQVADTAGRYLVPVAPMAGEMGALSAGTKQAAQVARDVMPAKSAPTVAPEAAPQPAQTTAPAAPAASAAEVAQQAASAGGRMQSATTTAGKYADLAAQAQVSPERVAAAERQGLIQHLDVDHLSDDGAAIRAMQGLKSLYDNTLKSTENENLRNAADAISQKIQSLGASDDPAALNEQIKSFMMDNRDAMKGKAREAFDTIKNQFDSATPIQAEGAANLLNERVRVAGGDLDVLSPPERSFYRKYVQAEEGQQVAQPTYGAIDVLRKQVGNALGNEQRAAGIFPNTSTRDLTNLYNALSTDQRAGLPPELQPVFDTAQQQSAAYLGTQRAMKALFGKELSNSLVKPLQGAGTELGKGNLGPMEKILQNVPAEMKQGVVATAVLNSLKQNGQQAGMGWPQFANWMDGINKSTPATELITQHIGGEAMNTLRDLGEVARGVANATSQYVRTGAVNEVRQALAPETLMGRMWDRAVGTTGAGITGLAAAHGGPLLATASHILTDGVLAKVRPNRAAAAARAISSPEFKAAAIQLAHGEQNMGKVANTLASGSRFKALASKLKINPKLLAQSLLTQQGNQQNANQ